MNVSIPGEYRFTQKSFLGIAHLSELDIHYLLERANQYYEAAPVEPVLAGRSLVNLFFENSTRTQASFEIAAKRLGADVLNMNIQTSSVKKGETLIDTAVTLNAMNPDLLVVRHGASGAVDLLSQKVNCAVINAGDGAHEHPTQALLDALALRRRFGRVARLTVTVCGDIAHSRVARSNILLLNAVGARVRLFAPPTLLPDGIEAFGVEICKTAEEAYENADAIMALRIQNERMRGGYIPSVREFYNRYGVTRERLKLAVPHAVVMHPGPVNRGVEIESDLVDDPEKSLIREQVQSGVAARTAVMAALIEARKG